MLKIENVVLPSAEQWEAIIRGMRNPKNSWDRMDSAFDVPRLGEHDWDGCVPVDAVIIGPNDKQLMTSLANGGPVHAKYRRKIVVYLDITAPLYWWKEFDTYKIGTSTDSCSTMHKIHAKEFTLEDFSTEHLTMSSIEVLNRTIDILNQYRWEFVNFDKGQSYMPYKKNAWWQMIQLLPTSYNQRRSVMLNYEVLVNIYKWRKNHRLDEWHTFCDWIVSLPYSELITGCNKEEVAE